MATLGTLVTVVTADTSGFQAGMGAAAQQAQRFGQDARSGLGAVEEKLSSFRKSLGGLREITELAFGFHVGRMFFEQIHDGIGKFVEGMTAARGHGLSWSDSLQDGLRHLIGIKTQLDEIAEAEKRNAELAKETDAARQRGIGQERSRNDLLRSVGRALGEELPEYATPKYITDPKLLGAFDELHSRIFGDQDKIAAEQSRLAAIEAEKKALYASYSGPNDKYYEQLDKLKAEERDARAKILEHTEDQKLAQQLLSNYTKAAAEKQKQINEEAIKEQTFGHKRLIDRIEADRRAAIGDVEPFKEKSDRIGIVGLTALHDQFQESATNSVPAKQLAEHKKTNVKLDTLNQKMDALDTDLKNKQGILWA